MACAARPVRRISSRRSQLTHLNFTAPGGRGAAFALMKRQLNSLVANRRPTPARCLPNGARAQHRRSRYSARPITSEAHRELRLEEMHLAYVSASATPPTSRSSSSARSRWTHVKPLLERYIASLPSTGDGVDLAKPMEFRFPDAVHRRVEGPRAAERNRDHLFRRRRTGRSPAIAGRHGQRLLETRLRDELREARRHLRRRAVQRHAAR